MCFSRVVTNTILQLQTNDANLDFAVLRFKVRDKLPIIQMIALVFVEVEYIIQNTLSD